MLSLQTWMKWNKTRKSFKVGNIVLLKYERSPNQWPMTHVVQIEPDINGMVRSAMLKLDNTKSSETSRRSIPKLVLLVANNEN